MLPGSSHPTPAAPYRGQEPEAALENLAQSVLREDQNLIIWGQDPKAMARAAQTLHTLWCNHAPAVSVEHFTGQQRLAWLSHINLGIAQLGLAQAMQTPEPSSMPRQIAIISNADQLLATDVQMLQDMTSHLPGLRWRWVLLCLERSGTPNSAAVASMSTSKPHPRWKVEPFPLTPILAGAHAHAHALGLATPSLHRTPLSAPQFQLLSKRLPWLVLAALLPLGVWGAWLAFSAPNSTPPLTSERPSLALDTPPHPLPSDPQPSDPAPSALSPSSPEEEGPASDLTAKTAELPPASAPSDIRAEVPDLALRGARWLAQQSPDFFVLEHGAFQTAAQAQSLIRTREELVNARVLMRKDTAPEGRFLVVTGPFRSQERAQNFKVRANLPSQIPVRRVSEVLQESVEPARPSP